MNEPSKKYVALCFTRFFPNFEADWSLFLVCFPPSTMGQEHSKRSSAVSTKPLTSNSQSSIAPEQANDITRPAPPRRIHHLSELINLDELFPSNPDTLSSHQDPTTHPKPPSRARTLVQSPSGQELDAYQYLNRADRPLTLQERQARITERLEQESRLEGERRREYLRTMQAKEAIERKKRKKRKGCCGGWL